MSKGGSRKERSPSRRIDERLEDLGDWRGKLLERLRALIHQADPEVVEEWKWNVPVWSHDGLICTGETYKKAVKLTFAKGAALEDPAGLFNSSLEGHTRRAIDFHEGGKIDEKAFKALIRAAVKRNTSGGVRQRATKKQKHSDPLIEFCRSLPAATEDVKWGDNLIFSVGGKMFAGFPVLGGDPIGFKVAPLVFGALTSHPGIRPARYMARHSWVEITDRRLVPRAMLKELLADSHRLVSAALSRKTREKLGLDAP